MTKTNIPAAESEITHRRPPLTVDAQRDALAMIEYNMKHGTVRQKAIARELLMRFLEASSMGRDDA